MSNSIRRVFLYGEFQTIVPQFTEELWSMVNKQLKEVKGLVAKTWLLGIGTHTIGGFYEFDSEENARNLPLDCTRNKRKMQMPV
ncbi:YdhR family protein [Chitinophaga sancti]|uniref:YdhR family protein n=1 Tax=Chitinophaga sancti TaxID=1004 RepID=A0A1K1P5K8_9BACT|nr:YdhR family protein [Chitinophaga sancti]WQD60478.1 YdhR family protein [Chitinophaga sancti]WQG87394.1 YdhR family protein [Chitinophaga sancti]SFW42755.1 hypothetical protein SAMN05661012_01784 [Chitinophaga sancti]